jgi:hypothetical protein
MVQLASTRVLGDSLGMEGNPVPKTFALRFLLITCPALNNAKFIFVTMKLFTGVNESDIISA